MVKVQSKKFPDRFKVISEYDWEKYMKPSGECVIYKPSEKTVVMAKIVEELNTEEEEEVKPKRLPGRPKTKGV